jgi:hypothetical protein
MEITITDEIAAGETITVTISPVNNPPVMYEITGWDIHTGYGNYITD